MIDNSLNVPIFHSHYFENDKKYLTILNKEVDHLVESNDDCWGRLDTSDDTWSSYAINKDILFNNEIFDVISNKLKDTILQYAMSLRTDTLRHQVHLMDSSIYVSKSNPKKQFESNDSQHFTGHFFLKADDLAGNIIIKNPIAPKNTFRHTGESPLREYYIKEINTGDLIIFPSHIEYKMTDFDKNNELRMITFGITVA
jgi:hypothetical protein